MGCEVKAGFTLIELMIVIAIAAVLTTIALPAYTTLTKNNRMTSNVNTIIGAFQLARNTAVTRQTSTTICASSDSASCDAALTWEVGWVVIDNSSGDLLKIGEPLSGSDTKTFNKGSMASSIIFNSRGFPDVSGSLVFCDDRGANHAVALHLLNSGRSRTSDFLLENGGALTCS